MFNSTQLIPSQSLFLDHLQTFFLSFLSELTPSLSTLVMMSLTVTAGFIHQGAGTVAPAQAQSSPCNITTSDGVSGLDSVSVVVSTPGRGCNFTLSSPGTGGEGRECRKGGSGEGDEEGEGEEEGEEVFTCALDHLEAGTSYLLLISSQTDQEEANITLHTSKSTSTSSPAPVQTSRDCWSPVGTSRDCWTPALASRDCWRPSRYQQRPIETVGDL